MFLHVPWAATPTFSASAVWGGAAQATLPGCSLQRGDPSASCRAESETAIRQENLVQCSIRKIQRPTWEDDKRAYTVFLPLYAVLVGEGITVASPSGHLCQGHWKPEKGGKKELKILELDTRSYNEKLQNFKIEKWLAYNVGEVHSCYWVTTKSASEGFCHLAEGKKKNPTDDARQFRVSNKAWHSITRKLPIGAKYKERCWTFSPEVFK